MRKSVLYLLAVLLTLGILLASVSCRNGNGPGEATGTSGGGNVLPPDSGEEEQLRIPQGLTFDDAEFRILTRNGSDYYANELYYAHGGTGTKVDQAVFSRNVAIEETYHVVFSLNAVAENEIDTWMNVASLSAGIQDAYHLIAAHGRNSVSYVVNGLTADWNLLPYINLDASWWNQDAITQWTALSGSIYMMTGDISYPSVGQAVGMFFNKTILNNVGLAQPYELVRNGEWTSEKFREYVLAADDNLNGDDTGSIATDSFGYATGHWRGPMNIIYSINSRWLEVTPDEITVVSKSEANLINAFDDFFNLLFQSGACAMIAGDYTSAMKAFEEGRIAFYDDIVLKAQDFKRTELDFGLVPSPKYDSSVDHYYTFVNAATNTFTIPKVVVSDEKASEMVSVVLEVMAYEGQKRVMPTYYEDILTYNSMTDMDSVEMMGVIRSGLTYDLGYYYFKTGNICDIGYIMANEKASRSFATIYGSLIGQANTLLEDWLNLE